MPTQTIPTVDPKQAGDACKQDPAIQLIDVRTPPEFEQAHAQGARSLPLDQLSSGVIEGVVQSAAGKPIYVLCQSGARAAKAVEQFMAARCETVQSVAGGTSAWEKAGLPMVRGSRRTISIERQVRIVAGALVLLGALLAWFVYPAFIGLSGFVGAGLIFAGITDWCGMGLLMTKMPWNR